MQWFRLSEIKLEVGFFTLCMVSLYAVACAPTQTERPAGDTSVILGSFRADFDPSNGSLNITVENQNILGTDVGSNISTTQKLPHQPNFALGAGDSLLASDGRINIANCNAPNWDPDGILSVNFSITNVSHLVPPYAPIGQVFLPPLQLRITGFVQPNVVREINSNMPEQGCSNPIQLSTCDADTNGFFDILWPDDTLLYTDDTGRDLSLLLGADNQLDPAEVTPCDLLSLKFNSETPIVFYFDVLGKIQGVGLGPPTVDPLTSPTNDLSPNIRSLLSAGADTIRIAGGAGNVTCDDGAACDVDGLINGEVTIDYTLNTNSTNNLLIFQQETNPGPFSESAAAPVSVEHDNTPPTVTTISPPNGAIHVSRFTNILVTFDDDLEGGSVNTSNFLLNRDGGIGDCSTFGAVETGVVTQPKTNEVLFNPNAQLRRNQLHCFRVIGLTGVCDGIDEVRDAATNCLTTTLVSQFTTTNNDTTAPQVLSVVPPDNASNVSINTTIQVIFDEPMDPATVTSAANFLVEDGGVAVTGTRVLSSDGLTATFTPSANLATNTEFQVTITTNVTDLSANNLQFNYISFFTTGNTIDNTPPQVVLFTPPDLATNINENVSPQVVFDEPMNSSTINSTNITLENQTTSQFATMSVTLSPDGLTATLNPDVALDNATDYVITVSSLCTDLAGNNLAAPQTSLFTTATTPDTTPPNVISVTPANYSSNVSRYTSAVIVFDEPINPVTVNTSTFTVARTNQSPPQPEAGSVQVASDGLSATFIQSNPPLRRNRDYNVRVLAGTLPCTNCVKDVAGNPLGTEFLSIFRTDRRITTNPTVTAVAPGDTSTGISLNSNVFLTFSDPIDVTTLDDSAVFLTIPPSPTHMLGTLALLPDGINVRFNPTTNFSPTTTYQIDVTNQLQDLAGRAATPANFSFTTWYNSRQYGAHRHGVRAS